MTPDTVVAEIPDTVDAATLDMVVAAENRMVVVVVEAGGDRLFGTADVSRIMFL